MEIVIESPKLLLWMVLGMDAIAVASVLLKKGPLSRRIVSLVVVAAVSVVLLVMFLRPGKIAVTDQAIVDSTYMRAVTVPWQEVTEARLVRDFARTDYRPAARTGGVGLPNLKTGWYRLANGKRAHVLIQSSTDALVVETAATVLLLAPDRLSELVAAVREHVGVAE